MKKPPLTAPLIALLGASFFVASVAGQPTQFERAGNEFMDTVYAYEMSGDGQSSQSTSLQELSFYYWPYQGAYRCSVESRTYSTASCKGGFFSAQKEGGLRIYEKKTSNMETSPYSEDSISCRVVPGGGDAFFLKVVETSLVRDGKYPRIWEHDIHMNCREQRCKLQSYSGSYSVASRYSDEVFIGSLVPHSRKEIRRHNYAIPLECRGDTTWISAAKGDIFN